MRQGGAAIQLARSGSDWVVKQPLQARGDYSAIEGLITKLASASMTKIVERLRCLRHSASYGLDKPVARVTLGAGSSRATLAIGKEENGAVYAQDPARGMVFADRSHRRGGSQEVSRRIPRQGIFEFRNFNLARLRVTRGNDTYELQKVAGTGESGSDKWQRVGHGAAIDLDAVKMDDFLAKLVALRAQSFVTGR